MTLRTGLWLYQRLAGKKSAGGASDIELKRLERVLDAGHKWSFFDYEDAQCEFPERLVAEWLMEAVEAGAVVRNHTEVLAANVAHGRVHGYCCATRSPAAMSAWTRTGSSIAADHGPIASVSAPRFAWQSRC